MTRFLYWLTARLPCRIINGEHGEPYLERYFLFRLVGFTAYIHRFVDNDPDRGLHDHPWSWSCSLILAGGYHELRATHVHTHTAPDIRLRYRRPGRFNVIRGDDFHRIILHWGKRTQARRPGPCSSTARAPKVGDSSSRRSVPTSAKETGHRLDLRNTAGLQTVHPHPSLPN